MHAKSPMLITGIIFISKSHNNIGITKHFCWNVCPATLIVPQNIKHTNLLKPEFNLNR